MPEELLPQRQSLNKAIKQQMWLLQQRARQSEQATSAEDLDEIAQELQKLQEKEAKKLQTMRQEKEEAADVDTVPARRQYRGKHTSQSVKPDKTKTEDSCAPSAPPQDGVVPEKGRKKSRSQARKPKKKQKDEKEEPEEGNKDGDGQQKPEEGKKDPPGDGSAPGPATAAA